MGNGAGGFCQLPQVYGCVCPSRCSFVGPRPIDCHSASLTARPPLIHLSILRRRLPSPNQVDNGLGGLRTLLEDLDEWDNTVVIFFSDNGGLPSHGSVNRPFRGAKGEYWEGGVHVPAFLSGGFVSSAIARNGVEPYRYGHLTHVTDIHTTILRLAGLADDEGETLDGVDLWEALVETKAPARESVVINLNSANFAKSGAVRWGKYKLMRNPEPLETAIYSHVEKKLINEELVVSEVRFFFFLFPGILLPFFLVSILLWVDSRLYINSCSSRGGGVAIIVESPPTLIRPDACVSSLLVKRAGRRAHW